MKTKFWFSTFKRMVTFSPSEVLLLFDSFCILFVRHRSFFFFSETRKTKAEGKTLLFFLPNKDNKFGLLKKGIVDVSLWKNASKIIAQKKKVLQKKKQVKRLVSWRSLSFFFSFKNNNNNNFFLFELLHSGFFKVCLDRPESTLTFVGFLWILGKVPTPELDRRKSRWIFGRLDFRVKKFKTLSLIVASWGWFLVDSTFFAKSSKTGIWTTWAVVDFWWIRLLVDRPRSKHLESRIHFLDSLTHL